jgi:ABC-type thiamine transport system ATPase subunit
MYLLGVLDSGHLPTAKLTALRSSSPVQQYDNSLQATAKQRDLGVGLSGGRRQRIAIARALLKDPRMQSTAMNFVGLLAESASRSFDCCQSPRI